MRADTSYFLAEYFNVVNVRGDGEQRSEKMRLLNGPELRFSEKKFLANCRMKLLLGKLLIDPLNYAVGGVARVDFDNTKYL